MAVLKTTLVALFASRALAVPIDEQKEAPQDGLLQLPFFPMAAEIGNTGSPKTKRQVMEDLDKFEYKGRHGRTVALGTVIEIGTPPQKVVVEPDTASVKLWVPGLPDGEKPHAEDVTYYDTKRSSSVLDLKRSTEQSYVSQRYHLDMFADNVSVGGLSLKNMTFGVGNMSHPRTASGRLVGTMGLNTLSEDSADTSVMKNLKARNLIKTETFSMALRKKDRGSLTLGGYDTSKFSGPLEKLPVAPPAAGRGRQYVVSLKSLTVSPPDELGADKPLFGADGLVRVDKLTVGIDSGSEGLIVSKRLYEVLRARLGGRWTEGELLQVKCDIIKTTTLDLALTDKTTISIPLHDFLYATHGDECELFIGKNAGFQLPGDLWIGPHFLRRAYTVFSAEENSVYVARGADCGSTLAPINGPIKDVVGKCEHQEPDLDSDNIKSPVFKPLSQEEIEKIIAQNIKPKL